VTTTVAHCSTILAKLRTSLWSASIRFLSNIVARRPEVANKERATIWVESVERIASSDSATDGLGCLPDILSVVAAHLTCGTGVGSVVVVALLSVPQTDEALHLGLSVRRVCTGLSIEVLTHVVRVEVGVMVPIASVGPLLRALSASGVPNHRVESRRCGRSHRVSGRVDCRKNRALKPSVGDLC